MILKLLKGSSVENHSCQRHYFILNINVLDKIDPDHWIFLYFVLWPCWILFFISWTLDKKSSLYVVQNISETLIPVSVQSQNKRVQCWACTYSMIWDSGRISTERRAQKNNMIISGSHRGTNWKSVVDFLHGLCPRRFRKNIMTSQSPSALIFLTWALVQCTQMMWTSSDTKW